MTARTSTRRSKAQHKAFFEQGKRDNAPCWLCGQPISYDVPPGTTPDSHELDHYYPVSTHPELQDDPTAWRHSHRLCNEKRSNNTPMPGLGDTITDWW
jgi:hypothetical protein